MEYTIFPTATSDSQISIDGYYSAPWGAGYAALYFFFYANSGRASWYWIDYSLSDLMSYSAPFGADFHFSYDTSPHFACINVPESYRTFTLTEDGLVGEIQCDGNTADSGPWNDPEYNYFRLLPYWHYAE
jgi:hypothetical protein